MGSVAKRTCARGSRCLQVLKAGAEGPPKPSTGGNLCRKCESWHAGAIRTSNNAAWARGTLDAIQDVGGRDSGEASLYDLFEIKPPHLVEDGLSAHLGQVVGFLEATSLRKLEEWIGNASDKAVDRYGLAAWAETYLYVGLLAGLKRFEGENVTATRVDGTKGGTDFYFRAKRLLRARGPGLPISQRDIARRLGVGESWLRRMRNRAAQKGYPLDGPPVPVPVDVIREILGKGKRGPRL